MAFEPQNQFETSLVKAAQDPAFRPQFYRDLVQSELLIPHEGDPPCQLGIQILPENSHINIPKIEYSNKLCIPVFSSLPRLEEVLSKKTYYVALNALDFMKITKGDSFILNPGSDYGKEFTKEEIASIIDGSIWQLGEKYTLEKETKVRVGQPAKHPDELIKALSRLFKQNKNIKRAYLGLVTYPEEDKTPNYLIGIETTGGWDDIIADIALVTREIHPDLSVDGLRIKGDAGLEEYLIQSGILFYKKKLFGIL